MADKFLNTGGSGQVNLSNGTTNIFAAQLAAANLNPSRPIKTNAVRELVSQNLDISDVNNLQTDLTIKNELSYIKSDTHSNPSAGQIKTYFKTDGDFYKKDENGTETKLSGGTGDVVGPNSSVDNTIPKYDGTTGKLIQNSNIIIDDFDRLQVNNILPITAGDIGTTTKRFANIYGNYFISGSRIIDVNSDVSSSAANQIVLHADTSGKVIKNSNVIIDGSNNCTGMNNITLGGTVDTQLLNVNGLINAGANINNFGLITSQGYRAQLDNTVDIGETAKQIKDIYIKGDIKYNKPSQNIFLGNNAGGTTLSTGEQNVGIGRESLSSISSGNFNTCISNFSGRDLNTGSLNTLLGHQSGQTINSGVSNICLGDTSGQNLTSGNNNIHIGSLTTGGAGVSNSIVLGSNATNTTSNTCVIGDSNIQHIRPSSQRVCDLGTSAQNFKDIYGNKIILNTQAQSNQYYNKNGSGGIDVNNTADAGVSLTGNKYQGKNQQIVTLNASGLIQQPSANATIDGNGNGTFKNLDILTSGGKITCQKIQSNDAGNALELVNRSTTSGVGIIIDNTTAGNIRFSGSKYTGTSNRIPFVDGVGQFSLSNATLDSVGNLIASNTTLDSLTLKNNLNFDIDNSHDIGSASFSVRSIYYKSVLNGAIAYFTGPLNTSNILPITTNVSDIGSSTLKYKDLYLNGTMNTTNSVATSTLSTNNFLNNIFLGSFLGGPGTAGTLNCNTGPIINTGDIKCIGDNAQDIGTSTATFRNIYVKGFFYQNGVARGDVFGPASSTIGELCWFNTSTGQNISSASGISTNGSGQLNCQSLISSGIIQASNNDTNVSQIRCGDASYAYISEYGSNDSDSLYLYGANGIYSNTSISNVSDRNYKKNISPYVITEPLDKVNKLSLKSFNYIDSTSKNGSEKKHFGYIAQDVEEVYDEAVEKVSKFKTDTDGKYLLDDNGEKIIEEKYHLTPYYITLLQTEAIKELTKMVQDLTSKVQELENKNLNNF